MAKMHKKLEKAYKQKSTAQRLVDKEGFHEHMDDLYERVPDLTEYQDLWLCLQLMEAVRTVVQRSVKNMKEGEPSKVGAIMNAGDQSKVII
jgi:hypothetical protein